MSSKEQKFTIGEALSFSWEIFKSNTGLLVLLVLILLAAGAVLGYIDSLIADLSFIYVLVFDIISIIVNTLIGIGVIKITLDLAFERETSLSNLYLNARYFWRYLGASILYGLIVIGGTVLLVFPGIIWGIKYSYYGYNIVEKDMGILESLRTSGEMTMGYKGRLFWIKIVFGVVGIAGLIALGVGFLVTYPLVLVAQTWVYRKLS